MKPKLHIMGRDIHLLMTGSQLYRWHRNINMKKISRWKRYKEKKSWCFIAWNTVWNGCTEATLRISFTFLQEEGCLSSAYVTAFLVPKFNIFTGKPLTKRTESKTEDCFRELTNVLSMRGLVSGMKGSFWNVRHKVVSIPLSTQRNPTSTTVVLW